MNEEEIKKNFEQFIHDNLEGNGYIFIFAKSQEEAAYITNTKKPEIIGFLKEVIGLIESESPK